MRNGRQKDWRTHIVVEFREPKVGYPGNSVLRHQDILLSDSQNTVMGGSQYCNLRFEDHRVPPRVHVGSSVLVAHEVTSLAYSRQLTMRSINDNP